jgi:hypothetical protein
LLLTVLALGRNPPFTERVRGESMTVNTEEFHWKKASFHNLKVDFT